jgi:hypothetical protein
MKPRSADPGAVGRALDVARRVSLPIWIALGAALAAAVLVKVRMDVPWYFVMGDPATTTRSPFFLGFISNVGALAWTATATVFLFRHFLERTVAGPSAWSRFLLCSGLFVALLGLDDLFLIHDQVVPDYLSASQGAVVAAYAAAGCAYLGVFRHQIALTAYPVLFAAFALLAISVGLDQLQDRWSIYLPASGFLEDAAKLLGVGTWLSYALHTCATLPVPRRSEHAAEAPRLTGAIVGSG